MIRCGPHRGEELVLSFLSLSWTLATQWCPHGMSSEGVFLRLPQVAHKGGHAHPGCEVLKPALSARAHPGEATPPAPSWQRREQPLVLCGRACASFSRPSLSPLSLVGVDSVLPHICWNEL